MILLIHLICALTSIVITTISLFRPTRTKLRASYLGVAATLASGTYLVVSTHSSLLSSCMSGLFYLSVTGGMIVIAQARLARETIDN